MTKPVESRAQTLICPKSLDDLTNAVESDDYKGKHNKKSFLAANNAKSANIQKLKNFFSAFFASFA